MSFITSSGCSYTFFLGWSVWPFCDAAVASSFAVTFLFLFVSSRRRLPGCSFLLLSLDALCVALLSSPSPFRIVGQWLPVFVGFVWLVGCTCSVLCGWLAVLARASFPFPSHFLIFCAEIFLFLVGSCTVAQCLYNPYVANATSNCH